MTIDQLKEILTDTTLNEMIELDKNNISEIERKDFKKTILDHLEMIFENLVNIKNKFAEINFKTTLSETDLKQVNKIQKILLYELDNLEQITNINNFFKLNIFEND